MKKVKLPYCKSPCSNCPFRRDVQEGWLGEERMEGILKQSSFVCHKTAYGKEEDKLQCAGHMTIKGENNDFVQLANRMGLDTTIRNQHLIFDNEKDLIKHHKH